MPSTRTHDVCATIGEYTNSAGEKKKRYITVGSAFTDEQGRLSIKLDAVPVTPEWSGWLSLYEPKPKGENKPPSQSYRAPEGGRRASVPPVSQQTESADDLDEIPF